MEHFFRPGTCPCTWAWGHGGSPLPQGGSPDLGSPRLGLPYPGELRGITPPPLAWPGCRWEEGSIPPGQMPAHAARHENPVGAPCLRQIPPAHPGPHIQGREPMGIPSLPPHWGQAVWLHHWYTWEVGSIPLIWVPAAGCKGTRGDPCLRGFLLAQPRAPQPCPRELRGIPHTPIQLGGLALLQVGGREHSPRTHVWGGFPWPMAAPPHCCCHT